MEEEEQVSGAQLEAERDYLYGGWLDTHPEESKEDEDA